MESKELEFFSEEDENSFSRDIFEKFGETVIWNTDWTVETIVSQASKGNIDLAPKFQRRDAWKDIEKSKLIESLILGIPIPPIILAEKDKKYIVIDGKQRLLTLMQFFSNKDSQYTPLKLKKLEYLKDLNNETYLSMQEDFIKKDYLDKVENQVIRTIVIKNWPNEEFLYTVFLRLNTGSKKLSPQELRQALNPGPFLDYLDDATATSSSFHILLNNEGPDSRMRDVELALRYFAFKCNANAYRGQLKDFLDSTCSILNSGWEEHSREIQGDFRALENAIDLAFDIFGPNAAFSRYINGKYNKQFNRPLFEVLSYLFSIEEIYNQVKEQKETFKFAFEQLSMGDQIFNESITSTTNNLPRVLERFNKLIDLTNDIIPKKFDKRLDSYDGHLRWIGR